MSRVCDSCGHVAATSGLQWRRPPVCAGRETAAPKPACVCVCVRVRACVPWPYEDLLSFSGPASRQGRAAAGPTPRH
eukprot:15483582-Alexandrium_andersonii.AAC.1